MIFYKRIHEAAILPHRLSDKASGYDLTTVETYTLQPGERKAFSTGLEFGMTHMPLDADIQIRPRSGLALKHGITVLNSPGTIDLDYTGEIKIILINHGEAPYEVKAGDKIAQLVIGRIMQVSFWPAREIEATDRGKDGFGSTGR